MLQVKHATNEKHKSIGTLQSSGAELKQKISDLLAKREALLAELKQVEEALTQPKQEESQLLDMLKDL
jgi:chromosome segregation ATPase